MGDPEQQPAGNQDQADGDDEGGDGGEGHQHVTGQERSDDGPAGTPGRQPAHRRSGLTEIAKLQLDHRRRHGTEHGGRRAEPPERQQHAGRADGGRTGLSAGGPHDGNGGDGQPAAQHQEHRDQPPGIGAVGQHTTHPGPGGDTGQDGPDDGGVGLEVDADVGGEQPTGQDLEDQHRTRGAGYQGDGQPGRQGDRNRFGGGIRCFDGPSMPPAGATGLPGRRTTGTHHRRPRGEVRRS